MPGSAAETAADHADSVYECVIPLEAADEALGTSHQELELGYECPTGVPYCRRDSQCAGYCGPGGFDVCYRGCCTCAG